jgi:hypothetical protein
VLLGLCEDALERWGLSLVRWLFWPGVVCTAAGGAAALYHWGHPGVSITDKFATAVAYSIRSVPGLIPWHIPVTDVATYVGVLLMLPTVFFYFLKRINRLGGTKRRGR